MPYINFSNVKKTIPGDFYLKMENLIAIQIPQPNRVVLNFGGAMVEVIFNPKSKDTATNFANYLISGNSDISSFIPDIINVAFNPNHMIR